MEFEILDGFSDCFSYRLRDVDGIAFLNHRLRMHFIVLYRPCIGQFRQTEQVVQTAPHDPGSEVEVQVIFG